MSGQCTAWSSPSTFNTCHIRFAGTNRLEDVDIYAFDPPAPADAGTLNNVAVNSTDEVLKGLLRADITNVPRRIAGWENHRENLPEDPSQVGPAIVSTHMTPNVYHEYMYITHMC